jgi:cytochrome bd-type quinol oxidase subunit 2
MRGALARVYLLLLALWVGGGFLYTFVVTPVLFAGYPRDTASGIVGQLMPHYFRFTLLAVAAAAAALFALRRSLGGRARAVSLALVCAALLMQATVSYGLYPRILAAKAQVKTFEADAGSPARVRFRTLHGASMALNLLTLADGAALLLLAPLLRRAPG